MRGDAFASKPVLSGAASRQVGLRSQGHAVGPDITLGTHGVGRKKTGPEAHRRVARLGWCRVLEAYRGANRSPEASRGWDRSQDSGDSLRPPDTHSK